MARLKPSEGSEFGTLHLLYGLDAVAMLSLDASQGAAEFFLLILKSSDIITLTAINERLALTKVKTNNVEDT